MRNRIRFLTRDGCHLCDLARPVVARLARRHGLDLIELDVDADEDLQARYGSRVPIVLGPEDQVLAEGDIADGARLNRVIRKLSP